jgi:hypothetical protein
MSTYTGNGNTNLRSLTACLAVAALGLFALPATAPAKKPASLYWGVQMGTQLTPLPPPYEMGGINTFAKVAGKKPSIIAFSVPWADCRVSPCYFFRFAASELEKVRRYGAIPFMSWGSQSTPSSVTQPDFELKDIINGTYDLYLQIWAEGAADYGHPFFLRFDPEMNGFWFPWSESVNNNSPGEFKAAWRHIHDIFTTYGATNVSWVWCPNVDTTGHLANLGRLYPGGRYVDWTCLDGFNWGERRGSPGWLSFNQIYHSTYNLITKKIAPTKPMIIGEIASTTKGGNKAAWITDMFKKLRTTYRKVRGVIWYDVHDRGTNWPIESGSKKVKNAFRRSIGHKAFRPNIFSDIEAPLNPPQPAKKSG